MSSPSGSAGPASADLQFDKAVPLDGSAPASDCSACSRPVTNSYYSIYGHTYCADCAEQVQTEAGRKPGPADLARATLYGFGAAVLGTAIYYAVLALSGYEIGWIAVVVGWLVGHAVRKGGLARGGWKLQAIAVAFTYCSIVASYVPLVVRSAIAQAEKEQTGGAKQGAASGAAPRSGSPADSNVTFSEAVSGLGMGVLLLFGFALVVPFLQGFHSILGIFIIGIGLFEAWKLNRRPHLEISGPHPMQ